MEQLLLGALGGVAGANIIARMSERLRFSWISNSVIGAAGGIFAQVILMSFGGGWILNIQGILGLLASGALGGGLLQAAAATLKKRIDT